MIDLDDRAPPAPLMLAGHEFKLFHDRCTWCRKPILDLMTVTRSDVGLYGIAHSGQLTESEFNQIDAYRNRFLAATKS